MLKWITNFTYKIEDAARKQSFVYKYACKYYQEVIEKEIALGDITSLDNILCIGGGICPFSAILFHQLTGASVTVIDNNQSCVPKAREVINQLGIGGKVQILHQDGNDIDASGYSVIHFALQVFPMEQVFESIEKQAKPGTKLLVRRPKKQLGAIYSAFDSSSSKCTIHKARNIGSTILSIVS